MSDLTLAIAVLMTTASLGTPQISSFQRFLPGYEVIALNAPIQKGNAFLLRCSNTCHKLSCNLWTWDSATQECTIYDEPRVSNMKVVSGTSLQNYVRNAPVESNNIWFPIYGTWEDAEQLCTSQGAILSYVPDQAWMKSYMVSVGANGFFTGVRRYDTNNQWYDLKGSLVSSVLEWSDSQPDTDNEYCTAFFGPGLDDVRCNTARSIGIFCKPTEK